VAVLEETYQIPADFNVTDYLGSAWNIHVGEKLETIKLRFNSRIAKVIMQTIWHPSQRIELQSDGSIIMTLGVQNTMYVRHWIVGWGNDVEVLEPKTLRNHIVSIAKSILTLYNKERQQTTSESPNFWSKLSEE
jgi:predicted DNA-binding transcriptional regulator YafY